MNTHRWVSVEEELRLARELQSFLLIDRLGYRIGPMAIANEGGEVKAIIVLQQAGQPKGVFSSVDALIDAVADENLRNELRHCLRLVRK